MRIPIPRFRLPQRVLRTRRVVMLGGATVVAFALMFANSPTVRAYSISNTNEVVTTTGGGGYIRADCPAGSVVNIMDANQSWAITRPVATCMNLNASATSTIGTAGTIGGASWGTDVGTELPAVSCSNTEVVVGMVVHKQNGGYVAGWQLICGTLPSGNTRNTSSTRLGNQNSGSDPIQTIECPSNMVAVGMVGYVGGILDRIGLRCGTITNADQTTVSMSSASTIVFGSTLALTATGGLGAGGISFATTGACTVSGSTLTATGNAGATCSVTATKAGDTNYAARSSSTQTVTIQKTSNTISFTNPGTKTWSTTTFNVVASATSGDTPAITSSTTSVCTTSGLTVTMVSSGTCTLVASEDGNTNYNAATNVTQTFTINPTGRTGFVGNSSTISGTTTGTEYIVERFTSTGNTTWTVPQGVTNVDLLVVGGGGGGGSRGAGGGGAGGYIEATNYAVTPGSSYSVVVGAGGAGAASSTENSGATGSASSFTRSSVGLTANGGSAGLSHSFNGNGGASGTSSGTGGTAYNTSGGSGAASGTCGSTSDWCGGGGGGATTAGATAVSSGGNGGTGRASTITGTSITFAGGGGGGGGDSSIPSSSPSPGGAGGSGGGGNGGSPTWDGTNCRAGAGVSGSENTGGGGGGGAYCSSNLVSGASANGGGGSGGSGIVVVRYVVPTLAAPDLTNASDNGSSTTDDVTSNRTLTFTGSAPITANVQLSVATASSASDTDATTGTWTNTGATCAADGTTGAWSCTTAQLAPGLYKVRSTATSTFDGLTDTQTSSTALVVNIDTTAPTVTISRSGSGNLKTGQTATVNFTLSESSADFAQGDITVSGGTLSGFTGSGTSYSVVFTPTANTQSGTGSLSVGAARFTDSATNTNTASSTFTITYDTAAPTISLSGCAASYTAGTSCTITITLSETTSDLTLSDFTTTRGVVSSLSTTGTSRTIVFTPTGPLTGTGSISVAANAFADADGNTSTGSNSLTIAINSSNTRQMVSSLSSSGVAVSDGAVGSTRYIIQTFVTAGTSNWTVPKGVTNVDLLVIGGGGGGGSRHRGGGGAGAMMEGVNYPVTPGNVYTVNVGAGGAGATAAGDGSAGSSSQFLTGGVGVTAGGGAGGGWTYAGAAATGSGSGVTLYSNNGGNGVSNTCGTYDWCGGGGGGAGSTGASAVNAGGNGGSGRLNTITGATSTYAGGGGGSSGSSSGTNCADPTPGGSGGSGGGGAGGSANSSGSIAGTAGVANSGSGGGAGGYCNDPNSSALGGSGGSGIVVVRYALPSVSTPDLATASDSGSSSTDNITSTRTLTFSGTAPVGASVQLSVATASSSSDTDATSGTWSDTGSACTANTSTGDWTCTTAQLSPGLYKVRSTATTTIDGVTDTRTTTTALVVNVDTTAPTVSSVVFTSNAGSDNAYKAGDIVQVSVTMSEAVTVTGTPRIPLEGLTNKFANYASGSGTSSLIFTYPIASGDNDTDGLSITADSLQLNSGTIVDLASNSATLTHTSVSAQSAHMVDTTAPTVTITRSGSGTVMAGETSTVTFTLSESSSDFVSGDVTTTGGTLSSFTGSGATYTATLTPTANTSGTASITIGVSAFTDPAGNANSSGGTLNIAYDTGVLLARYDASKNSSYAGAGATTWTDLTGNGRNATLVGSPSPVAATSSAARSISLPSSSYGTLHNRDFSNFSGGVTIQATLNFGAINYFERIIDFGKDSNGGTLAWGDGQNSDNVVFMREGTSNTLRFQLLNGTTVVAYCYSVDGILNNTVANYAVSLSFGGSCTMYRNGVALTTTTTTTYTTRQSIVTRDSNYIGRSNWTADSDLDSSIRSLYIYNRGISAAEVLANYNAERQFTITYDANNATSGTAPSAGSYTTTSFTSAGSATTLSANSGSLSKTGLGFGGWNTAADGSGTNYAAGTGTYQTASDLTLYAQWDDITPPTASLTTAAIRNTQSATGQSTETGTLYLVNTSVTVSNVASITSAAGTLWNSVAVTSVDTDTTISAAGLSDGTYKLYAVDASNNLSSVSSNSVTIDTTGPTVSISSTPSSVASGGTTTISFTVSESVTTFTSTDVSATLGTLTNFSGSGTSYTATFTASPSSGGTGVVTVASGSISDSLGNVSTSAFTGNVAVTNTSSSSGGRTSYLANGTDGTNGVRYFVERFTTVGSSNWVAPQGVTSVEYLVVAGGGGGGGSNAVAHGGGGGGAGGYRSNAAGQSSGGGATAEAAFSVTPGTSYSVVVGGGGSGGAATRAGAKGSNSQFGSITALGGGGGGAYYEASTSGGSGGGAAASTDLITGANGTTGQGFKGGNTPTVDFTTNGAGGGGSGGAGTDGVNNGAVASGGIGTASTITGSSVTRASGGNGGVGSASSAGASGTSNTGNGGGGGSSVSSAAGGGGDGGSGIVVVRYAVPNTSTPDLDAADDTGTNTDNITSATTLTFTGSAPAGSSVQLYVGGVATGSPCTADAVTGAWSCDTDVLTAGSKSITAESTTVLSDSTVTSTSSALSVTIDATAPTVSSVSFTSNAGADNTYKAGDTITVTVAFSENVTVTGTPRIPLVGLTNAFANYSSGSGTSSLVFTYTVASGDSDTDGLAITADTLSLNGGTITDAGSNNATLTHSAVSAQSAHQVDGVSPTVTLSRSGSGSLKSGDTETVTFTLSESSTNFVRDDITVSGGTLGALSGSGTSYSAVFTPATNTQSGSASISVSAGVFTDAAGNGNTASASSVTISYDTAPPTVSISSTPSSVASSGTTTISFTVSESVTTFTSTDVSATLGTLTNFSGSGTSYTATFTASTSSGGTATITVASGAFSDSLGNANTSAFTGNVTVTNTSSSSGGRTSYLANGTNGTNGTRYFVERFTSTGSSSWTVPQGVTSVDLLVVGGGGGGGSRAAGGGGGGGVATTNGYSVTPGQVFTVAVGAGGAGAASTSAANGSNGSPSSFLRNSVGLTANGGGGGKDHLSPGFGVGGASGTASGTGAIASNAGGTQLTGPSCAGNWCGGGGGGAGAVGGNAISTRAGNGGVGTTSTITGSLLTYAGGGGGGSGSNSNTPTPGGSGGDGGGGNGATASYPASTCVPVNGSNGVTNLGGGGGAAGYCITPNTQGTGGTGGSGIVVVRYAVPNTSTPDLDAADDTGTNTDNITSATTLTFTGSAPAGSSVQLYVGGVATGSPCTADAVTGAWSCDTDVLTAGSKSITAESTTVLSDSTVTSTSSALSVTIDATAPTVSSVSFTSNAGADNTYKAGDTITVTVAFSENVTVTGTPRIPLVGLTNAFANYSSGSGTSSLVFTYTVASGDSDTDGLAITADTLSLNGGTITDAGSNNATLTHSAVSAQSAHQVDGVSPTVTLSRSGSGSLKSGDTETVTFTLSESSTNFVRDDITVSGGTLGALSGSGTSYSAVFTPATNTQSGSASISVSAGVFTDAAGNGNTASASSVTISYDTAGPTITIGASSTTVNSGGTSNITFTVSETTTTFTANDVTTTLGKLTGFTGSGTSYTATFTASTSSGGTATITVASGAFSDALGNANTSVVTRNITVTDVSSNTGARTNYLADGSNGTNGTRYVVERFTSTGANTWRVPLGVTQVDTLIVAGGGGGGGGGGGAGGALSNTSVPVTPGASITVNVGAGGAGATNSGSGIGSGADGGNSTFGSTVAYGGGGGGGKQTAGRPGGSSGGTGQDSTADSGAASQGFKGGAGFAAVGCTSASGGGGAGSVGLKGFTQCSPQTPWGGNGGSGMSSTITGTTSYYAGGGGGGSNNNSTATATRGWGGGAQNNIYGAGDGAGSDRGVGTNALANTGSGGGGSDWEATSGGTGGSGIVVVRYEVPDVSTPDLSTASDQGSSSSDNLTSATTLTFTGSAPVGSSVQLYADGVATGNPCNTDAVTGAWSCTTGVLTSGAKAMTATSTTYLTDSTVTSTSSSLTVTIDTTAPTVSSVSFTSNAGSDNTYKAGDTINVTVAFSENVNVTGTPRIPLVGLTNANATYSSGSGTSSLVFTYTVASTDLDADGLAITADTLALNGGTISDIAGNNASLTHSAVSTQSTHQVDGVSPTVTNVTSSTANGTIGSGTTVSIQVVFSESVTVTGTPRITLETGATDRTASYSSGSGTSTLTFTYTVQSGDTSSDLDYVSANALALNGGAIADAVGNNATLALPAPGTTGSLSINKAIVIASNPTQIASVRAPLGTASGAAFATQPQVSLQDTGGSVVTSDNSTVVTASVSSGATLVGNRTATAVNGIVTFADLGISGTAGTSYTITYSATVNGSALTVATQSVTPTVGAATQLVVSTQPVGNTAGALLSTQPVVSVLDSGNNKVTTSTTSVTVTASGGTLGGTRTINASGGDATFTDLTFAGTASTNYTLTFAATNLGTVTSSSFSVSVGAATQLVLTTNASGAVYGEYFTGQPVVEVRDAGNNKVTTSTATVTATLSAGTVTGTSNTTITATASSGVATFSNFGITGTPGLFTITYSSGSLATTNQTITLIQANQTISFTDPADRAWSATSFSVAPTTTSNLTVAVTSTTTNICTVSGFEVTMVTVGTCSLTAAQAGNTFFNAATSVTQSFVISQASQTITFTAPIDRAWSATTFDLSPTASSGLTVSMTSTTTSVCTISTFTVTMVKAGTCTLTASQAGNTKYLAATSVTQSFEISLATQATFSITSVTATYGTNLTLATSGGSGTGTITFTKVSGDCTLSGSTLTPTAAGSCDITATKAADTQYTSAADTQTVTIGKADQSTPLTLAVTSVTYGQTLTLSASGGQGPGALSYTVSSGTCSLISAILTPGDAGSLCNVQITRAESANYKPLTSSPIAITVLRATPALGSFSVPMKTYEDADFIFANPTSTYNSSNVAGTWSYSSSQTSVATTNGSTASITGGGSSTITATFSPTDSVNFTTASTTATLTVNKATPTFSWTGVTATYGDADITIVAPTIATTTATGTWTYSSADTSVVAISGTKFDVLNAGSSVVTATFTPSNTTNFVSSGTTTMTFTVDRANQATLNISSVTGTYGTQLTLTTTGGTTNGSVTWGVTNGSAADCSISAGKLSTTSSGTCTVTATMAGNSNYYSVTNTGTLVTINAKPITVTATALTKTYGDNDPALAFTTPNGALVGNDTLSGSLTRVAGENVGEYTINQGTVANSNYNITYTSAKLTINAKPITVTATALTKTYGDNDPALAFTTPNGALVGNDTLSGSLTRVAGENVGEYTINQGTVANSNYNITYTSAKLTINAKPITVTAVAKEKTYGDNDPALTFTTPNGALVGNDTLSGSLTRVAGENVGEYTINQGTVTNSNYNISYTSAKLTINAKPITVTAVTKEKTYGDNDPALTFTTPNAALVGNDTLSGSLTRDSGEDAGSYTIRRGTLTNSNYNITFVTNTLTINQAQQSSLSVSTSTITYRTPVVLQATGGSEGDLSFSVASAGTAACSIQNDTLTATGNAGTTCTVTATRAATTNYLQKTSAPFTITVAPRAITLTATAKEKTYGDTDPGFTYVVTAGSLYGSDTFTGAQTRATGENVGTYSINRGTLANSNYTITYVPALLTINQRPITITAANKTKIFGENDPALTYSVTAGNVVNSDSFTGAITRAVGETLGTYNITRGTLDNGNYNITFVVGTFQITGAQQAGFTLTASSYSVVFQQTVTLQTAGGNGFGAVTFTAQDGTGSCSISGSTLTGQTAGTCSVTATKAAEGGYLVATSNVITITVDKADQTIVMAQMIDRDFSPTPMTMSPTSTSGSPVVLTSSTPNVCSVETLDVHMKDSGTCTITASVPESRNHNAAPAVARSFAIRAVVPFAPTITSVEASDATVTVAFTPGLSGGAPITTYRYSVDDGAQWRQFPDGTISSPLVIGNLPNDVEAKIRISAVNRVGFGARSNMKAATPVAKKSLVWEVERKANSTVPAASDPVVTASSNQLPPRPALVRTLSVQGGRRTQVTATRAAKDFEIPVTHAIISVRRKNGGLLARIQVRVDPNNPTTSVTVPYKSSQVSITVQFANDIGVSAGGASGVNLREGSTFLGTTIDGRPRLAGTPIPGVVTFAKGSSTLSSSAKAELKKSLQTAQARGGRIYVTGYANTGELTSAWVLESLARKRAENVAKYLISIGARQWITFHGAPVTPSPWQNSRPGHVTLTTVNLDQI